MGDMVRDTGGSSLIEKWLRNKNTIGYLGIWESLNNPEFNLLEFEGIKSQAGTNRFVLSVKQWVGQTSATGLRAQAGRYGDTYAHKDIAFEFGSWISPEFRFLIIKEFQNLKAQQEEFQQWDDHRFLTRINYRLHTAAVFGYTAKEWRDVHPNALKNANLRDEATILQLAVLANIEALNSMFISKGMAKEERFGLLFYRAGAAAYTTVYSI